GAQLAQGDAAVGRRGTDQPDGPTPDVSRDRPLADGEAMDGARDGAGLIHLSLRGARSATKQSPPRMHAWRRLLRFARNDGAIFTWVASPFALLRNGMRRTALKPARLAHSRMRTSPVPSRLASRRSSKLQRGFASVVKSLRSRRGFIVDSLFSIVINNERRIV